MAIGQPARRVEGLEKVTGQALYTPDHNLPRTLEAKVLRSPLPHARILNIDTSLARSLPGVKAVLTGRDLGERRYGNRISDIPVLAVECVLYAGEAVAAVAAVEADTAREALELIRVDYGELPPIYDPLAAMEEGAPVLHPHAAAYRGFAAKGLAPNVCAHTESGQGNLEEGFSQADYIFEDSFQTQMVHHGYMEPHACRVEVSSAGKIRVWSNHKAPFELRAQLARYLGVAVNQVVIRTDCIGGDFGGKGIMMGEPLCYYLAKQSGMPVRLVNSMQEELTATHGRHASLITMKSGVTREGLLTARQIRVVFNAGAYAGANSLITVSDKRSAGVYRIPHCRIDGYAVYTNSFPAGHCRAPGDPQSFFAVESHMDMLAARLGLDPLEFRLKNVLEDGDSSPTGLRWRDIKARSILEEVAVRSGYQEKKQSKRLFSGYGIALTERGVGQGVAVVQVMLNSDGTATVASGTTECGVGSRTMLCQVAAQELQLPLEKIEINQGDTGLLPYAPGSGDSRVTYVAGNAVRLAAQEALSQARVMAAGHLACQVEELSYENACFRDNKGHEVTLKDLLSSGGPQRDTIIGVGRHIGERSPCTCFCAQVAEVEVDPDTGGVEVKKVFAVSDIGRLLNPVTAGGQVEGAVVQGLGYALQEELLRVEGIPLVKTLADYKMPVAADAPQVEVSFLEGAWGPGPYGAKSIGEQGIAGTAPAIANAIYDAVGVRLTVLPLTPEKILAALQVKGNQGTVGAQG